MARRQIEQATFRAVFEIESEFNKVVDEAIALSSSGRSPLSKRLAQSRCPSTNDLPLSRIASRSAPCTWRKGWSSAPSR